MSEPLPTLPRVAQLPFADSRLKVERANKHIAEFRRVERAFRKRHPYSLILEKNPDPKQRPDEAFIWRLKVNEVAPTERLSLIAGDAIHNLRSALDIMAYEAVRRVRGNEDGIQFPVAYKAKDLEDAIANRHVERAGPRFVDIVRLLKPYKGGNPAIWPIHQLDIIDKHRIRIAAIAGGGIPMLRAGTPESGGLRFADYDFIREMKDGEVWEFADALDLNGVRVQFEGHVEPSFRIQFGKRVPFKDEPIIPTLLQLADLTLEIVKFFEANL